MGIFAYIVLFLIVVFGGLIGLFIPQPNNQRLKLLLSFSGAYLLGISVLHLMPEVFHSADHGIGIWVLGGFILQLFLEIFSKGVEHAHIHPHKSASSGFAFQILIGLFIHAFLEGMPLGLDHSGHSHVHTEDDFNNAFFLGIVLHKLPAAFALVVVLLASGFKRSWVLASLFIFACASPLGGWLAESHIIDGLMNPDSARIILALVLGSFIHIATTILFEMDSSGHHNISINKLVAIIVGLALAIFITL